MSGEGAFVSLTREQRAHFKWLQSPSLVQVIEALETAEAGAARFVGGCVRDSLFGESPKDFDIATTLKPDDVIAALRAAGLGAAPTGYEHGTVTAIVDHRGVEVTSLRADIATDGRRATIAFTRDWATDAARRDFTINAIYATPDGRLYDPVGGIIDAAAGAVRFIGEARARIREDYLRILRFFRFSARFSKSFDTKGLSACAELKSGVAKLSVERVGAELTAILALPRAPVALRAMIESGVLGEISSAPANVDAAARLKGAAPAAAPPVVLGVLFGEEAMNVAARLRFSNAQKAQCATALEAAGAIGPALTDKGARALIYRFGNDAFADGAAAARALERIDARDFERLNRVADDWTSPALPFSGRHVIAAGVAAGPDVARLLAEAEAQWIDEDFPSKARAFEILAERVAAAK